MEPLTPYLFFFNNSSFLQQNTIKETKNKNKKNLAGISMQDAEIKLNKTLKENVEREEIV